MFQSQQSATLASAAEIVPANYFEPLDLQAIFGRMASLEVDLGCGDGAFLAGLAAGNPERDFLGTERLAGRIRQTESKISRLELTNARVCWIESSYAIRNLLPAGSVAMFHLMFPDPWPKRRHWNRRVVNGGFLSSVHRALSPNGLLRVVTDQADYFRTIESVAAQSSQFDRITGSPFSGPMSTFEKRFRELKIEVHSLVLRKVSPVT